MSLSFLKESSLMFFKGSENPELVELSGRILYTRDVKLPVQQFFKGNHWVNLTCRIWEFGLQYIMANINYNLGTLSESKKIVFFKP